MNRGYTILELLMAAAISGVLLAGLATTFAACGRMMALTLRDGELSVAARQTRDRLLFSLGPPAGGSAWAGLLSGTNAAASVVEGGATPNVLLRVPRRGPSFGAETDASVRLVLDGAPSAPALADERAASRAASRSWLVPNGFALAEQRMADVVTPVSDAAGRTTSLVFDLTLKASAPGISAQRAERVRVPLLGRVQP